MSNNVVEFPGAEREVSEREVNDLHAEAFRDLENRLNDWRASPLNKYRTSKPTIANWSLRSRIHGNCWRSSRRTTITLCTVRTGVDCTPLPSRRPRRRRPARMRNRQRIAAHARRLRR
jgi:hypothetical protein